MQYLIKEFKPGEEIKSTLHLVTDDGDETNNGTLWMWIRRAVRRGVSISVHRVGPKAFMFGRIGPIDRFLVIDDRSDESRRLSIVWPSEAKEFVEMQERGEPIAVHPTECVLDLS